MRVMQRQQNFSQHLSYVLFQEFHECMSWTVSFENHDNILDNIKEIIMILQKRLDHKDQHTTFLSLTKRRNVVSFVKKRLHEDENVVCLDKGDPVSIGGITFGVVQYLRS